MLLIILHKISILTTIDRPTRDHGWPKSKGKFWSESCEGSSVEDLRWAMVFFLFFWAREVGYGCLLSIWIPSRWSWNEQFPSWSGVRGRWWQNSAGLDSQWDCKLFLDYFQSFSLGHAREVIWWLTILPNHCVMGTIVFYFYFPK